MTRDEPILPAYGGAGRSAGRAGRRQCRSATPRSKRVSSHARLGHRRARLSPARSTVPSGMQRTYSRWLSLLPGGTRHRLGVKSHSSCPNWPLGLPLRGGCAGEPDCRLDEELQVPTRPRLARRQWNGVEVAEAVPPCRSERVRPPAGRVVRGRVKRRQCSAPPHTSRNCDRSGTSLSGRHRASRIGTTVTLRESGMDVSTKESAYHGSRIARSANSRPLRNERSAHSVLRRRLPAPAKDGPLQLGSC